MAVTHVRHHITSHAWQCPKVVDEMKRIPDLSDFDIINDKARARSVRLHLTTPTRTSFGERSAVLNSVCSSSLHARRRCCDHNCMFIVHSQDKTFNDYSEVMAQGRGALDLNVGA